MNEFLEGFRRGKRRIEELQYSAGMKLGALVARIRNNLRAITSRMNEINETRSRFDLTDPVQQKQAWHWSNLQPLEAAENNLKRDKILYPQLSLTLAV
jgi:hypothetical protein